MGKAFQPTTHDASSRILEVTECIRAKGYVLVEKKIPYQDRWGSKIYLKEFKANTPLYYAAVMEDEVMASEMIDLLMNGRTENERERMLEGCSFCYTPLCVAVSYRRGRTVSALLRYHRKLSHRVINHFIRDILYDRMTVYELGRAHVTLESLFNAAESLDCHMFLFKAIEIDPSNGLLRLFLKYIQIDVDQLSLVMMQIIFKSNTSAVKILLEHGADSNVINPYTNKTPLMEAVQYCRDSEAFDEMYRVLRSHGATLNKLSSSGWTALTIAFRTMAFPTALKLIRYGANVNSLYGPDEEIGNFEYKNGLWGYCYMDHRRISKEPEDYTIWLERYYNLRGLNKMLVYYGLDVARLCTVDENNVDASISVGKCHLPNVTSDPGGGQELRAWMLKAKEHIEIHGPMQSACSVPPLVSICRERLFQGDCNVDSLLELLPASLQDFVSVLNVKAYDPRRSEDDELRSEYLWERSRGEFCPDSPFSDRSYSEDEPEPDPEPLHFLL